ncbi:MAG: cation diffusion facilitator family transporter [Sporolactobacillus sp.]
MNSSFEKTQQQELLNSHAEPRTPHHHHGENTNRKALLVSFILISLFMLVEGAGGMLAHSLTLLSDAGHMLSDSISLGLSLTALIVGAKIPANNSKTFGYRRFEILAALFNGVLLLVISIWIIIEAISRFSHPAGVASLEMLGIAIIGLLVNVIVAAILMRGESADNLNVKSALIHVLGDLLGSIGAIVAALLIYFFGWQLADPAASILVSLVILHSGWQVTRESIDILMESRPGELDLEEVRSKLSQIDGVLSLHDLHIWTITSGFLSLSCHMTVNEQVNRDQILHAAESVLAGYHLEHSTIQLEGRNFEGCHADCAHQHQA